MENFTTERVRKNIKRTTKYSLNKYSDDLTVPILRVHGMDKKSVDYIYHIDQFLDNDINAVSHDDNSNKGQKTIHGMYDEGAVGLRKIHGYQKLYQKMKELYGKKEAKRLSGEMYTYKYAMSDSSNILKPYCFAFDSTNLLSEGRPFGQLHSKPSKHVDSFISALTETIHQMSHHLAGAVAINKFFINLAILGRKNDIPLNDKKYWENVFQRFIFAVNHLSRSGAESPFTNVSIFGKNKIKPLIEESVYLHNFSVEEIWEYVEDLQDIFMDYFESEEKPFRFPVVTINIEKDNPDDMLKRISHRKIERYNIFSSEGTKVSSCCRLISNAEMMSDFGSSVNSFGAGATTSVGSHRVITLNLNRCALESNNKEEFFKNIRHSISDIAKILKAHKELLKSYQDAGLHLFLDLGWLSLPKMFSTLGLLGYSECKWTIDLSEKENIKMFKIIDSEIKKQAKKLKLPFNIEQIPAESMSVRLAKVDRMLFGSRRVPFEIYSNQFIPLWKNASIVERLKKDGEVNQLLTGGGIVHINTSENLIPEQKRWLIKKAIEYGCEHFAINPVYSECESSHMTKGDLTVCPICSGKIVEKYTRVVGFFTPVTSWSPSKKEFDFDKRVENKF